MEEIPEIPGEKRTTRTLFITLLLVFLSMLIVMFIYEVTKQILFPAITLWQSHFMTIAFTGVVAVLVIWLPLRDAYRERQKTEEVLQLQQQSEGKLKRSFALMHGIMESPKDVAILALDREYRYLAFNENHRRMMKETLNADISLGTVMPGYIVSGKDRNRTIQDFDRALGGESFTSFGRYGRHAPEGRWFAAIHNPIRDENGTVFGLTVFIADITENKRAEEAIRLAYRKINLLSGITRHDLRNQLMVLDGYIALSMNVSNDRERLLDYLARGKKVMDVIGEQLDFARDYEEIGVKSPQWQNIHAIVTSVATRLPMRNINLTVSDPGPEVYADPLLEKVFFNLMQNALNYGGDAMTAIHVTTAETPGALDILVADDGAGISAGDKAHLFTRGFGKHTGLGLYLSREILSITDITITEDGEPGRGARFRIRVPKNAYRFTGKIPDPGLK